MIRHDYAHPLRIDTGAAQVARATYPDHVAQMIRQLLLTSPGERVNLPTFGCGLRGLLFAPQSDGLVAAVRVQVQGAIDTWLADQVDLQEVTVLPGSDPASGIDEGALLVTVSYELIETRKTASLEVLVG